MATASAILTGPQATKTPGYLPIPPEYAAQQQLTHELDLFGFPLSCHPLDLFKEVLERIPHLPATDLAQHVCEQVTGSGAS